MIKIWHNDNCSKSKEAKTILEEQNIEFEIFEYLKNTFTKTDIELIMLGLGIDDPKEMLRKKESEYKTLNIDNKSKDEILDIVVQNPKLVERPIIIKGKKAVIARPMENLVNLLKD